MTGPVQYWPQACASAAVAVWALFRFVAGMRRERLIADTPLVKIRSAAQGYVKVFGRAGPAGDAALAAPLSARTCVWWSYEIAERRRDTRDGSHWHVIESATSVTPFLLTDQGGACLVGPVNAEITPTDHDVWYRDADVRCTERRLAVGAQLSVTGELCSESNLADVDEASAALLREWKHDQPALLARFDRDHDGKIDGEEWQAARVAAVDQAGAHQLMTAVVRTSVIGQPTHGEPFLIAPMVAKSLMMREKISALLFLGVGLICVCVCGWTLEHAASLPH